MVSCVSAKFLTKNKQHDNGISIKSKYIHQYNPFTVIFLMIEETKQSDTDLVEWRLKRSSCHLCFKLINYLLCWVNVFVCDLSFASFFSFTFLLAVSWFCGSTPNVVLKCHLFLLIQKRSSPKTRQRRGFTVPDIVNS